MCAISFCPVITHAFIAQKLFLRSTFGSDSNTTEAVVGYKLNLQTIEWRKLFRSYLKAVLKSGETVTINPQETYHRLFQSLRIQHSARLHGIHA